jgi:hypothetical protein
MDPGPLELIGGRVTVLSTSQLATSERVFDYALDLGAGTALGASLKTSATLSVGRSALLEEGKLGSMLRERLQFSAVSA